MALPTEVIESLTWGKPILEENLNKAWVVPILDLVQTGIVRPTKELWRWEFQDARGRTLAHETAVRGLLPKDFDAWCLADQDGWTVAHEAAKYGLLPEGFDQWALADRHGWTVAHVTARWERLPQDFDQWTLADHKGWTVAHVAAGRGHLPKDFDQWSLADQDGWTVAHVAAAYGHLPNDFDQWDLEDRHGQTVAEVVITYRPKHAPSPKDRVDFWLAPTSEEGCSVMDLALKRGVITSEEHEAIQQIVLKAQQAHDQARMKRLTGMVF